MAAGATGATATTFDGLPAGTVCTVTETADGATATTSVTTVGSPQPEIEIPAGDAAAVQITNTYEPTPGSLVVTKTIAGSAAGQQGEVVINVSCTNGPNQDIVIPAGTTADTTQTLDGLPAGHRVHHHRNRGRGHRRHQCLGGHRCRSDHHPGRHPGRGCVDQHLQPGAPGHDRAHGIDRADNTVGACRPDLSDRSDWSLRVRERAPGDRCLAGAVRGRLIGALFVAVGAILLVAGRRRGQEPTRRAGD